MDVSTYPSRLYVFPLRKVVELKSSDFVALPSQDKGEFLTYCLLSNSRSWVTCTRAFMYSTICRPSLIFTWLMKPPRWCWVLRLTAIPTAFCSEKTSVISPLQLTVSWTDWRIILDVLKDNFEHPSGITTLLTKIKVITLTKSHNRTYHGSCCDHSQWTQSTERLSVLLRVVGAKCGQ